MAMEDGIKFIEEIKNEILIDFNGNRWKFIQLFREKAKQKDYNKYGFDIDFSSGVYTVYYWFNFKSGTGLSVLKTYQFKLPRKKKYDDWAKELKLKDWIKETQNKIYKYKETQDRLYFLSSIFSWIDKLNPDHPITETMDVILFKRKIYLTWTKDNKVQTIELKLKVEELTLEKFYELARIKSKEFWDIEFNGTILLNNKKWKNRMGCYRVSTKTIELNHSNNIKMGVDQAYDTFLHELVHWYLHTTNQKYDDTDDRFIQECLEFNIALSDAPSAKKAYHNYCLKNNIKIK